MSIFSDMRAGLKVVLDAYYTDAQLVVYEYERDVRKDYPCLVVHQAEDIDYQRTAGSNDVRFILHVTLYLHSQDSIQVEQAMDDYKSPTGTLSLRAAIESDHFLNATVTYAELVRSGETERGRDQSSQWWELSAEFEIDILINTA